MPDVNSGQEIINSRDIIARIDELEDELDGGDIDDETDLFMLDGVDYDAEYHECETLKACAAEGELYAADWQHGATLIHEDHFEAYAEQFARDIGAISDDDAWPIRHIDWTAAADELREDYTEIEFDGETYLTLTG